MSGQVEQHGCIVCGKTHTLKVIYAPGGRVLKCEVTSLGGRRVFDPRRPIVACDTHSAAEIEAATPSTTLAVRTRKKVKTTEGSGKPSTPYHRRHMEGASYAGLEVRRLWMVEPLAGSMTIT